MIDRTMTLLQHLQQRVQQVFERKPDQFLERLREQSQVSIFASEALISYMNKPSNKNAQKVRQIEKDGDELRRMLVDELNKTFVTPIDREDIHSLSRALDDIIDDTWFTVNEMDILGVAPNEFLGKMAELIARGSESIKLAMDRLEQHPAVATTHAMKAKSRNNDMETLYAEALADLFQTPKNLDKVVDMLKLREIYRHLYHASGRIDDASNIINDIVMKFF